MGLHQRRDHFEQPPLYFHQQFFFPYCLKAYFTAFLACCLEILLNLSDARGLIHIRCTLKMMVQASVIQIDRPHYGLPVVADKHFCVDKARRIFIDFHTGFQKGCVMSLGKCVGKLLIRYTRLDQ